MCTDIILIIVRSTLKLKLGAQIQNTKYVYWNHSDYFEKYSQAKLGAQAREDLPAYSMFGAWGRRFEGGDWYKLDEHTELCTPVLCTL